MNNYICNCGKSFEKYRSYIVHGRFCSLFEKGKYSDKPLNIREDFDTKYLKDGKYTCECGKSFDNYLSLCSHFSHCDLHHELNDIEDIKRPHEINGGMSGWDKFSKDEINEIRYKSGKTHSLKIKSGEIQPG